ncbi:hypothetical protein LENED_000669 [Lentinula edodes]|uniref:Uncharacterized protein n=1 Tax=Lentinula edodes TaxID=5353 RepID=A0A1Q3DW49_LENED|nr:hypothetical protein LENED_000669 [Lentinula edodes]
MGSSSSSSSTAADPSNPASSSSSSFPGNPTASSKMAQYHILIGRVIVAVVSMSGFSRNNLVQSELELRQLMMLGESFPDLCSSSVHSVAAMFLENSGNIEQRSGS